MVDIPPELSNKIKGEGLISAINAGEEIIAIVVCADAPKATGGMLERINRDSGKHIPSFEELMSQSSGKSERGAEADSNSGMFELVKALQDIGFHLSEGAHSKIIDSGGEVSAENSEEKGIIVSINFSAHFVLVSAPAEQILEVAKLKNVSEIAPNNRRTIAPSDRTR